MRSCFLAVERDFLASSTLFTNVKSTQTQTLALKFFDRTVGEEINCSDPCSTHGGKTDNVDETLSHENQRGSLPCVATMHPANAVISSSAVIAIVLP